MSYPVRLSRDSWKRFNNRSYRVLLSGTARRQLGEFSLSQLDVDHPPDDGEGVLLRPDPQHVPVLSVWSDGSPTLTGNFLGEMLPSSFT